ncbi:hypothetical protein [Azovibrio restrictus]|nr:hypothetical protein [Azovibrio restrictus]
MLPEECPAQLAVDAIFVIKPMDESAQNVEDELLDACLAAGYGIFAG